MHVDHGRPEPAGHAQQEVHLVVVVQNLLDDVVAHRLQQLIALVPRKLPRGHGPIEQDLQVHLMVGRVDSG